MRRAMVRALKATLYAEDRPDGWRDGAPHGHVLYVLLVSRCGQEPGRYQSEPFYGHDEAEVFLKNNRAFFENDGRHNVWLAAINGQGMRQDEKDILANHEWKHYPLQEQDDETA